MTPGRPRRARQPAGLPDLKTAWAFRARFRTGAFGWRGTKLAIERLKQALSELKAVGRHDPLRAADGAVLLIERLSPAFEQIDSSSGALGTAVNKALDALIGIIIAAPAPEALREHWLERLFEALQDDGYGYVEGLGDRWGELCVTRELAAAWADRLVPTTLRAWSEPIGYFPGTMASLSALLHAGRHEALLAMVRDHGSDWWPYRSYAVRALAALGRVDEAIALAEVASVRSDDPDARARLVETMLLDAGRRAEAYDYALEANAGTNRLATFRAIKKKYPEYEPAFILKDLIRRTPGEEGKWFATAKALGRYDLALELADRSPVDHHTLMRAAGEFQADRPRFAMACAMAAVRWMVQGYGYDLTRADLLEAFREAMVLAEQLGEQARVLAWMQEAAKLRTEAAGWLHGLVGPPPA